MSIWSSERLDGDVSAIRRDNADDYTGEGPETAWVDVATATPWHDKIRLGIGDTTDDAWDPDLLIDVPNAEKLIADLQRAVGRIKAKVVAEAP